MKILSLDIASFGKFKNYQLDLPDNMTVVFGENENGKSTIMSFIRMMFYGNTGKNLGICLSCTDSAEILTKSVNRFAHLAFKFFNIKAHGIISFQIILR